MNGFNDWLGTAANYCGVLTTVPIVWTWILAVRDKRRQTKIINIIKNNPGQRPIILIISLLREKQDIRNQVEKYRQKDDNLKNIEEVIVISIDDIAGNASELTPEHLSKFMGRVSDEIGKIYRNATDVIHYFHGGPFPTAAMVGAQFANGPQVLLYHWNRDKSTYENWGPLRRPV